MAVCDAGYQPTLAGRAEGVLPALPQPWRLVASRVELAVWPRASARVQPACARKCRARPMLAGPWPTRTAVSWVVVLHMLGRYALVSYASLGRPRYGVVGRQGRAACDSIISVILPGTLMSVISLRLLLVYGHASISAQIRLATTQGHPHGGLRPLGRVL